MEQLSERMQPVARRRAEMSVPVPLLPLLVPPLILDPRVDVPQKDEHPEPPVAPA